MKTEIMHQMSQSVKIDAKFCILFLHEDTNIVADVLMSVKTFNTVQKSKDMSIFDYHCFVFLLKYQQQHLFCGT